MMKGGKPALTIVIVKNVTRREDRIMERVYPVGCGYDKYL